MASNAIKDLTLEKGMYHETDENQRVVPFVKLLERLDPSENYEGPLAKLSAFERQLARFGIRVKGPNADVLEKFFATTTSAVLFPAYVSERV